MQELLISDQSSDTFCTKLWEESGQDVAECYQCGKCTAGCPLAPAMDLAPNQVMRLAQLGLENEVLNAQAIWLCAYCSTCSVRCPRGIHVAEVMDALRRMARRKGLPGAAKARRVAIFNDNFLATIKRFGRLHEVGSMLLFNLLSGRLFQNADVGYEMFRRGKIKLLIGRIKEIGEIRKIFQAVDKRRGQECPEQGGERK